MNCVTVSMVLMFGVVISSVCTAYSCDSCGSECSSACGTRYFRTCCFNYLRKRSSEPALASLRVNPWMSRSQSFLTAVRKRQIRHVLDNEDNMAAQADVLSAPADFMSAHAEVLTETKPTDKPKVGEGKFDEKQGNKVYYEEFGVETSPNNRFRVVYDA